MALFDPQVYDRFKLQRPDTALPDPAPAPAAPAQAAPDLTSEIMARLNARQAAPAGLDLEGLKAAQAADAARERDMAFARAGARAAGLMTGRPADYEGLTPDQRNARNWVMQRQLVDNERNRSDSDALRLLELRSAAADRNAALGARIRDSDEDRAARAAANAAALEARAKELEESRRARGEERQSDREFRAEQARLERETRAALAAEARAAAKEKADKKENITDDRDADRLRREFQAQDAYKNAQTIAESYKKIKETSDTGAGDLSLIYAYMKMVDPGSTVREGEFATAASAGSVPDRIVGWYNRVKNGEKLPPEVRKQFRSEARTLFSSQVARYKDTAKNYQRMATERGYDPDSVVLDTGYDALLSEGQPTQGDTVTVMWKGKPKSIPRAKLADALKAGATEVK